MTNEFIKNRLTMTEETIKKIFIWCIVIVLIIILLKGSIYTIKSTERGVLSTFGKMNEHVIEP